MGMIRKTMSIGTLGLVSFRSKKELLERSESSRLEAEARLTDEQAARLVAEARVEVAEKQAEQASRRERRAAKKSSQKSAATMVGEAASETTKATRRAARRARKRAATTLDHAQSAAMSAKETVVPKAEHLLERVGEAVDELTTR